MKRMQTLLLLAVAVLTQNSCSITRNEPLAVNYPEAMNKLRASATAAGIPRRKVFYHFQLYAAKSSRMFGGVRGGYASTSESWVLPDGYSLTAFKHRYVGRNLKITPLKSSDFMVPMKEEYYPEPQLEPFFDAVYLLSPHNKQVAMIELPRKTKDK